MTHQASPSLEILNRMGFCKMCEHFGRPRKNEIWVSYNPATGLYEAKLHIGERVPGHTPHLMKIEKPYATNRWSVKKLCAMHGCGVDVELIEEGNKVFYHSNVNWQLASKEDYDGSRLNDLRRYPLIGIELSDADMKRWNIEAILAEHFRSPEGKRFSRDR